MKKYRNEQAESKKRLPLGSIAYSMRQGWSVGSVVTVAHEKNGLIHATAGKTDGWILSHSRTGRTARMGDDNGGVM
jgi:hypothetical protein